MTREEAIKVLSNHDGHGIPSGYNCGYAEAIEVAIGALEAEPIVRCKDCKWWDNELDDCAYVYGLNYAGPEDFCSHGERAMRRTTYDKGRSY